MNSNSRKEERFKKKLTLEQHRIMREKDTEPPFTGKYLHHKEKGMYVCAACRQELSSSEAKFDSGTGWPSFTEPVNLQHIKLKDDFSSGSHRIEVLCKNCGSHLGHVFDDLPRFASGKTGGPKDKGGKRYCINSVCLNFKKQEN